jgi:hypothetical protein
LEKVWTQLSIEVPVPSQESDMDIDCASFHNCSLLLAHGRWFSPGTSPSSTTKTGHHDIAEISLKVALKPPKNQ